MIHSLSLLFVSYYLEMNFYCVGYQTHTHRHTYRSRHAANNKIDRKTQTLTHNHNFEQSQLTLSHVIHEQVFYTEHCAVLLHAKAQQTTIMYFFLSQQRLNLHSRQILRCSSQYTYHWSRIKMGVELTSKLYAIFSFEAVKSISVVDGRLAGIRPLGIFAHTHGGCAQMTLAYLFADAHNFIHIFIFVSFCVYVFMAVWCSLRFALFLLLFISSTSIHQIATIKKKWK